MNKEEYMIQLSVLEQQAREIQQQVVLISQKINDLNILRLSLGKLEKTEEKEFLAPLGEGIFIKAKLEEKDLFVNVGAKVIVKKSVKETEGIIDRQNKQLEEVRRELEGNIDKLNNELQHLVDKAQKEQENGEGGEEISDRHENRDNAAPGLKSVKEGKKKS